MYTCINAREVHRRPSLGPKGPGYDLIKLIGAGLTAAMMVWATNVNATELVYTPINPSFGGSPLNGSVLLNTAQATNKHKAPEENNSLLNRQTSIQQFNEMLERSILGQLASATTSNVIGTGGKLQPGTVETGNFRISIADLGGGLLQITTTDKVTGQSNSFQVGQ